MKSKEKQLQNRGFLKEGEEKAFQNLPFDKKINLLISSIARERTLGARVLENEKTPNTVTHLIKSLKVEKKLYAKIAICNTLCIMDTLAIDSLIDCLGKIGNNQHKTVPDKNFKKDSYPLPRDIAGRTLIRIGEKAIPSLLKHMHTKDTNVLSELIDTIGYISFYNNITHVFTPLKNCYNLHITDTLIIWKIIRALSGIIESKAFLKEQYVVIKEARLKLEIERSLRLITR